MKSIYKYYPARFAGLVALAFFLLSPGAFSKSTFSGERIKKACMDYIYKTVGERAEVSISQSINNVEFEDEGVIARCTGSAASLRGNTHVAVEFAREGKLVKRIEVPVRIRIFRTVPVLKRSMAKGSAIGNQDFGNEDKDVTYIANDDFPKNDEIAGASLNRNAPAGTVLTRSMMANGAFIKSGDKVNIVVQSGAVRIRTGGTALQDAASGSPVRVKREGTQTILQGTVAPDGSVLISTGR